MWNILSNLWLLQVIHVRGTVFRHLLPSVSSQDISPKHGSSHVKAKGCRVFHHPHPAAPRRHGGHFHRAHVPAGHWLWACCVAQHWHRLHHRSDSLTSPCCGHHSDYIWVSDIWPVLVSKIPSFTCVWCRTCLPICGNGQGNDQGWDEHCKNELLSRYTWSEFEVFEFDDVKAKYPAVTSLTQVCTEVLRVWEFEPRQVWLSGPTLCSCSHQRDIAPVAWWLSVAVIRAMSLEMAPQCCAVTCDLASKLHLSLTPRL